MQSYRVRGQARVALAAVAVAVLVGGLAGCRTGEPEPSAEPGEPMATPTNEPSQDTQDATEAPTSDPTEEPTAQPAVNGPNTITSPLAGAEVPGPTVTVAGEGTGFEATLNYRVLVAGTTDVVAEGWTMAGANGEVGPYAFDVDLPPGEYTVEVFEPDVSDGESGEAGGGEHNLVSVTFTVA